MAELPKEFKEHEGKPAADAEECADKKADADAGEKLDKLLTALDSISKRMDAMEEEDKAKADAAKADEGKDVGEEPGKPLEIAADKKRKDAEETGEGGHDKDDEKELAELKATADAERARMDADIAKRIADVEAKLPRQMTDAEYSQMADAQARADAVYSAFGKRAPRPLDGETLHLYRRRLASSLKDHSKDWKSVDVRLLDSASFDVVEGKIYADAALAASRPDDLPEGEIRAISKTNGSGHRITEFVGNSSFIRGFKQPARIITDMPLAKQSRAG